MSVSIVLVVVSLNDFILLYCVCLYLFYCVWQPVRVILSSCLPDISSQVSYQFLRLLRLLNSLAEACLDLAGMR